MTDLDLPNGVRFISKVQAAERTGLCVGTIARMMRLGHLTRYRLRDGQAVRLDVREVDALFVPKTGPGAQV